MVLLKRQEVVLVNNDGIVINSLKLDKLQCRISVFNSRRCPRRVQDRGSQRNSRIAAGHIADRSFELADAGRWCIKTMARGDVLTSQITSAAKVGRELAPRGDRTALSE